MHSPNSQLARRELRFLSKGDQATFVATSEDTILAKLKWYRAGDEVSTTQWSDVLAILSSSPAELDITYLEHWANNLGVADLLQKALRETE